MSTIYLVFRIPHFPICHLPHVSPLFAIVFLVGKLSAFSLRKCFLCLTFSKNPVPIPHQMFSSETVVSALFLNARIFLPHFKMSLLPPKSAQTCLTNGLLAPHTTYVPPCRFHCTLHHIMLSLSVSVYFYMRQVQLKSANFHLYPIFSSNPFYILSYFLVVFIFHPPHFLIYSKSYLPCFQIVLISCKPQNAIYLGLSSTKYYLVL